MSQQRTYDPSKYAFVDIETTGLDPDRHHIWEIAVIIEQADHDGEIVSVMQLAEPRRGWCVDLEALRINRMADRYDPEHAVSLTEAVRRLRADLAGRHIVGANPMFDIAFLARLFDGKPTPWHYRPICVESMTLGRLGRYARGLQGCCGALGIPYDTTAAHSALHDAERAKDIFDALMTGDAP